MGEMDQEIIAAMSELAGGEHAGFRAAHAKGSFCRGSFTPAPGARELSRAGHLQDEPVAVTARFSNGGGRPEASDAERLEGRGLAVKFHLADGSATDIVALSLPVFFVRNAEDFLAFLRARKPDPGTEGPNMEKVGAFLGEHPETAAALQLIIPSLVPPVSYATCEYNSLHAFGLVNAEGDRRHIRYRFIPEAGAHNAAEEDIDGLDGDYLQTELGERLAGGPIAFALVARLGEEGDSIDDPTVPWPEERETVELGRLELTELAPELEADGQIMVFDPTNAVDGIELPDDKILHARSRAYSISAERRAAALAGA
ncbi:MAG: catalase [Solirubrobacterales bacterium]|jgi:catalase|nr:catalase [Solirubrobacterales bacterium]